VSRNNEASIFVTAKDRTKDAFSSVDKGLNNIKDKVFSVQGALLSLAGVGGMGMLINSQIAAGDKLAKTSDKLDIQTDKLGQLRYAAELYADMGNGAFDTALQRMTRRMSEAARGTGEAKDAIKELGLDAADLVNLTADEKMIKIADAMQDVESKSDRVRLAFKLFDTEGVDLVNMLDQGSGGLRAAAAEADALGIAMSRIEVAKLEAANTEMFRAGKVVEGVGNRLAIGLAPWITAVANQFVDYSKTANLSNKDVQGGLEKVAKAIGYVGDTIRVIEYGWTKVKLAFQIMLSESLGGLVSLDKTVSNILNKIPGIEMKPSSGLQQYALESTAALADTYDALDKLVKAPMPSTAVDALLSKIIAGAQAAAKKIADAANANIGKNSGIVGAGPTDAELKTQAVEEAKLAKVIDMHQLKFARLAEMAELSALDDESRAVAELDKKLVALEAERTLLEEHDAFGLERELAYSDARAAIIEAGENKVYDIRKKGMTEAEKFNAMSWGKQVETVAGALMDMTSGAADSNRAMFEVNKAAAIANAIVTGIAGVQRAFMDYPFPISAGVAIATAAATVANVTKIASTSFGSKSGARASTGSTSVPSQATSPGAAVTETSSQQSTQQTGVVNHHYYNGVFVDRQEFSRGLRQDIYDADLHGEELALSPHGRTAQEMRDAA